MYGVLYFRAHIVGKISKMEIRFICSSALSAERFTAARSDGSPICVVHGSFGDLYMSRRRVPKQTKKTKNLCKFSSDSCHMYLLLAFDFVVLPLFLIFDCRHCGQ